MGYRLGASGFPIRVRQMSPGSLSEGQLLRMDAQRRTPEAEMLTLTGITQARRDHSLRHAIRGPAILAFCFALAAAFAVTVWHGPACSRPTGSAAVASAAVPARAS